MPTHPAASIRPARTMLLAAVAAAALVLAACTDDTGWRQAGPTPSPQRSPVATPVALERAEDCDQLADNARATFEQALAGFDGNGPDGTTRSSDGARGIDDFETHGDFEIHGSGAEESMAAAPSADGGDGIAGSELIGTNNQELGVEEADLVDLDTERVVWVDDGVLRVAVLDDEVSVDGTLDLSDRGPSDLFLREDRILVLGTSHGDAPVAAPGAGSVDPIEPGQVQPGRPAPDIMAVGPATTTLTIVSIEDPTAPTILETTDVEGALVTARQIDGVARVVVRSHPDPFDGVPAPTTRSEAQALFDDLEGEQLLPRRWDDGRAATLGGCADVLALPVEPDDGPGGPMMDPANVTVLRVGDDLADLAPVTVQGAAETVYASTSALYVAANGWGEQGSTTTVHRFDLAGDGPATHTGSGSVPGRLLNQFALSERDGHLRMVTTIDGMVEFFDEPTQDEMVGAVEPMPISEGRLTVLDTDGSLDEVGHVDGLGPNEDVHSVRFIDDLAYVVTFRRTDPLYAIDLADPTNPTVLGELKITGFSEYLHPVGDGLLLGVGREVDEATGMDEGMKVSLFDISDPTALAEVDRFVLPDSWSQVGSGDHRAFTWDPARNRAIIPTETAALVVQVDGPTLATIAELSHSGQWGQMGPHRSRLHDGTIWTISPTGLGRTNADSPDGVEMVS